MDNTLYSKTLTQLESLRDEAYRKFNESLIPGAEGTSFGVRMPQLRTIAKEIIRRDWRQFLSDAAGSDIYEMIMLRGLVIATAPCEFESRLEQIAEFIPHIHNWAVCDCVCASIKSAKNHLPETFQFLTPYLGSQEEFHLRFGVVMLMDYFITEEYIDRVLSILHEIRREAYYVNMAIAWALSVCFVKFRDKTLSVFQAQTLSPWVQNKAIQKCRESRRVSVKDKTLLLQYKL